MNQAYKNSLNLAAGLERMILVIIILLSSSVLNLSNAQAPAGAQKMAEDFARSKGHFHKSSSHQIFDHITDYKDIWIFESSDPEAFILVKKEKGYAIAGYSFANTFSKNGEIPEPARLCLDALNNMPLREFPNHNKLKSYPPHIEPLLSTKWGQDCYFNYECPTDYRGYCDHVAAGCVPVAMGQIMKYYSRFNKVVFEDYFESDEYPDKKIVFGNYDWDKMAAEPVCIDLEVSRFLFHIGVVSKVLYNPVNTSTSTYNAWVAFGKMSYLESVRMVRSVTNPDTWIDAFYGNISEFMPMFVAGSGHAFVCDGYDSDGFFHFNLGWSGIADGYYPLIGNESPLISEALVKLRPHSLVQPPVNLRFNREEKDSITWASHPYAETLPFKYRIYQDDKEFAETEDTSFPVRHFEHGRHMIKVSAWYVNGESRWIGPLEIYNEGIDVNVPDENLRIAMNKAIGMDEAEYERHIPKADELISIQQIIIEKPTYDLSGIEYCRSLLELQITDNEGVGFDLKKLINNKKLKILDVKNARIENLDELINLNQLVYLKLNNVPVDNADFLSVTNDLLDLAITNTPLPALDSIVKTDRLEYLDLSSTNLKGASFVNQLSSLKKITLSDNLLEEFELTETLRKLRYVEMNNNMLGEMNFMENIPGIVSMEMDNNAVKSLELFQSYPQLERLSFAGNEIIPVKANRAQPKLVYVDLSGNHISSVDRLIEFAPGNQWLDLSDNAISSIWTSSYQHLTYLDLSHNSITNIEDIRLNPSLVHLNLSHNWIGDFYPLSEFNFYENFEYLDVTNNPGSKESFLEFYPRFESGGDTVLLDDSYSPFCPAYPVPARDTDLSENSVLLKWECGNSGEALACDLFFGEPGEMELISYQLTESQFLVNVDPDRRYQWQVISRTMDTSYQSGIFSFRTFPPIELPFFDGFEDYQVNNLISLESPYWITKNKEYNPVDDGLVVGFRHFSGKNSLKLQGNSHLILPLDNFSGDILFLEYALLIPTGQIGCVRLTEISGIKLELYFKVNKDADVLVNDKVVSRFGYLTDEWFPVKISLSGKRERIYIQADGITSFARDWKFPRKRVTIENIEFSGERSPNFPSDGFPLFYIDDLFIRELQNTGTNDIQARADGITLFPNPVDQELWITGSHGDPPSNIYVINLHGQRIREIPNLAGNATVSIKTSDLPTGLYWLYYRTREGSGYKKVIITH